VGLSGKMLSLWINKARKGEHVGGKYVLRWWKHDRWNYKYSNLKHDNHGFGYTATEEHTVPTHPKSEKLEHTPEQAFHYARNRVLRGTEEHTADIKSATGKTKYKVLVHPSASRPISILPPESSLTRDAIAHLTSFEALENWSHRDRTTRTVKDAQGRPWFDVRERGRSGIESPSGRMVVRYYSDSPHNPFPGEPSKWVPSPFTMKTAQRWIKEQRRQQAASGQRVKPLKRFPIDRDRPATTALEQGRVVWERAQRSYPVTIHSRTGEVKQRRGGRWVRHAKFQSKEERVAFYSKIVKEHFGHIVFSADRQLKLYNLADPENMARLLGYYGGPGHSSRIEIEAESPALRGVERAVNSYDPEKGWKFVTYLNHCLWWENFNEAKRIIANVEERRKLVTTIDHGGHTRDIFEHVRRENMAPGHETIVTSGVHTMTTDEPLMAKQDQLKDWTSRQEDRIAHYIATVGEDHDRQVTSFLAANELGEIKTPEQAQAFIVHWQSEGGDEFVEPFEKEEVSKPKAEISEASKRSWVSMIKNHPLLTMSEKAALLAFAPKGDLQNIKPFTEVSLELTKKHSREFPHPPSESQLVDIFLSAHQKMASTPEFEAMQSKLSPVAKALNTIRKSSLDMINKAIDILSKAKKGERVPGYQYWRREGIPGHYKYYYHDQLNNAIRGTNAPEGHKEHDPSLGEPQIHKNEVNPKDNPEYFDPRNGRKMNEAVPGHAEWNPEYDKETHMQRWAARWPKEDEPDVDKHAYYDSDVRERDDLKFNESNKQFDQLLPKVRKCYKEMINNSDELATRTLGLMVALLDQAYMRVGKKVHEQSTGNLGLTTLKVENASVKGNMATFSYIGKKGVEQEQSVVLDPRSMGILKELMTAPKKRPKDYLFSVPIKEGRRTVYQEIGYNKIYRHCHSLGVTPKQFRTYHGTRIFSNNFEELFEKVQGRPTAQMLAQIIEGAATEAGRALGHFQGEGEKRKVYIHTTLKSYIDPVVVKELCLAAMQHGSDTGVKKSHPIQKEVSYDGIPIDIENKKGSTRKWHDPSADRDGETKMNYDYGYIADTEGVDGDEVDVYIGPHKDSGRVFVVHQLKAPDFKKYDEDKVMIGFKSSDEAKAAYLKQYDNPRFFGDMKEMSISQLKEKISNPKYEGKMLKCQSIG